MADVLQIKKFQLPQAVIRIEYNFNAFFVGRNMPERIISGKQADRIFRIRQRFWTSCFDVLHTIVALNHTGMMDRKERGIV
jgi:hypothetical protein